MSERKYTLQELATFLGAKLIGDPNCVITGIGPLDKAIAGQISFFKDAHYRNCLNTTKASAIMLQNEQAEAFSGNRLVVIDPYVAYAKVSAFFDDTPPVLPGIDATALLGEGCEVGADSSIGPYCVIGRRVKIGSNVRIEAGTIIGDESVIGDNTRLCARVTLYHKVKIGSNCIIHSGVIIGSDGFGNANERGNWRKIYQLGAVTIGNDVEVGANTTIDRGALEDTIIEDGVRLDNQIQIGHNVKIGAHTAIAGCAAIAGSTKIGRYCMIGGAVGINGHINICDGVIITGMSAVNKSITEPGVYSSGTPAVPHRSWWRTLVRLNQLDDIARRLIAVEKKLS